MKQLASKSRWGMLALFAAVAVVGLAALVQGTAYAGPTPDCGPNFDWICVVPGCPSCPPVYFDGTVCEKNQFQKQTGRVCTRA